MTSSDVKRGAVYYIDNNSPNEKAKSEQGGIRPAVIISNDVGNLHSPVVIVAPLTAKNKKSLPTHVVTYATGKRSIILCEQITTISKERLKNYVGRLSEKEIKAMDKAVSVSLNLC